MIDPYNTLKTKTHKTTRTLSTAIFTKVNIRTKLHEVSVLFIKEVLRKLPYLNEPMNIYPIDVRICFY